MRKGSVGALRNWISREMLPVLSLVHDEVGGGHKEALS